MNRRFLSTLLSLLVLLIAVQAACRAERDVEVTTVIVEVTATPERTTPAIIPSVTALPDKLEAWPGDSYALDDFPVDAPLIISFNQPMNSEGSRNPLLFSPTVRGRTSWNEDNTVLTFVPDAPFSSGRSYTITLNANLKSASGERFSSMQRWRIKTQSTPQVGRRTPAGAAIVERQPTVRLSFSHPMDEDSVAAALRVDPSLAYELRWEGDVLIIALGEKLAFGTTYDFTLDKTAADRNGVRLARPYQWSYRLKDTMAGAEWPTASDPQVPIKLRFNYALNRNSAENALSFEPSIEGRLTWNGNNTVATFQPDGRLPANTDYTLTFSSALRSADGEELPLPAPVTFTTPPPILATLPTGEAANPAGHIEVRFDRPMDKIATEAAFHIIPETAGDFEWRETTLLFRPGEDYLAENTRYTVTIEPEAAGADGEPILYEPYSWTFKTGQLEDLADFGYGPNAQVLDVNGRRAVQFQAFTRELVGLQFELYRLNLNQFLDRYASGFRGWQGWEEQPPPISSQGTELVKSWRVETTKPLPEWTNVQEVIIPEDVAPGLYILNLVAGRVNDQLILVLSENTLTVKQAEGQIVAWVTDINGDIVPGIDVGVYARDGSLLGSGQVDTSGIFRTAIPPYEEGGPASIEPLIVVAGNGNDITVSGLAPEWSNSSGWGNWWLPTPAGLDSAAFVYTDRPIYKPGQMVYFKAIVRRDDDALLTLYPAGTAVTVRIRDARDNVVQTIELTTNDFGSVDGSFQLAEGAMLGKWNVEVVVNGDSHRQVFKVEDYRKPDYEVRVTTDAERYVLDDTIEVTVDTNYYFGEPVPNASIQIKRFVLSQNYYGYESSSDYTWYEAYDGQSIAGKTDENGRFTTTIAVTPESFSGYWNEWESSLRRDSWGIEATVDDGSHQTVSGFAVVHIFNASEEIRLDTGSYVQEPGKPFTVRTQVTTIFGEPVASRELTLELRRWNSGSYDYTTVVQSAGLTTGEEGRDSIAFTIEQSGYYQVRVSGKDARGLDIVYTSWIYAFSDFYGDWYGRNSESLSVAADQESYAPGDTASLMVESSFSGPALLTVERGTIRRERLVQLTAPLTIVEVPIEAGDVPNVYVAVNAWQEQDTTLTPDIYNSLPDSRLHTAYVNLSVPATTKVLNVTVIPDRDIYAPRDEATFTVRVTNYQGLPVSTEVSLALVDEAIFALSEELSGPMYDAFYYERANIVRTYNSMNPVRYLGGGRGGGGGDGGFIGGPRADFPDTAAWFPTLHTDFNGEVRVTVTLPDSLTSWRLTAKATTADTQVGEATANVLTQQPIVIRPILPRVLTAGDTVQLSAVVHNYSGTEQRIAVSIGEIGDGRLEIRGLVTQTITLASGELRVVGWSAVVKAAGESELLLTASPVGGDVRSDAVQLPLTIQPLAMPDVTTQVGQVSDHNEMTVAIPEGALEMSHVEVQLSRSIAGSLLEGLDYLTGFPYGCVEQTMSKALPNAVVGRALHQLGVTNPTLQADLPAQINASVQRLYGFQHNDGGWGWWYDDQTDAYQTAWVIFGLGTTAEAGYEIDPAVIERGVVWLNENLSRMDNRTRAFALYSMAVAGQPNREMTLALADQVDQLNLDTFSRAALALTLHKLGETAQASAIVDALAETAVVSNGRAHWSSGQSDDGSYDRKTMASATRNTAIALSALSTVRPGHELEDDAVRWLMGQRRQYGWGTTNETAFAIIGLTDHLLATSFSEAAADSHYNVMLNGVVIATGTLGRGKPATTLQIPREQLAAGNNTLVLEQSGGRQLYYVVNSRVYLAQSEIEAAGNIRVTRTYLDPETNKPLDQITAGQLVKVSLQVVIPGSGSFMMVEDRLPGGLEALNEGLNTTSHVASAYEEPYYWQDYGYNHKEIRSDRVSFFITEMNSGSHTFTYFARATHAGAYTAMPAEVSAMYDLSLWGRSASNDLVIKPQSLLRGRTPLQLPWL